MYNLLGSREDKVRSSLLGQSFRKDEIIEK